MKVQSISYKFLHLFIIFYLCLSVHADKQRIKIGIKQTDMPESMPSKKLEEYKNKLSDYFKEKTKNNEKLNKYEIDVYYYSYPDIDSNGRSVAHMFMVSLCQKILPKREYDMVVLDDRILLNDIALMESDWVYRNNHVRHPSLELLHDLSKYIKKEDLEIHDPKIVSGGMFEKRIIGIPYEFDFDVMYYHKRDLNSKIYNDTQLLLDNMENYTWNELIDQMAVNSQQFRTSFADDDSLLNFVIEYTSNHYSLSSKSDPNYIKLFYNETCNEYYSKFREFLISISKDNNPRNSFFSTLDNAYHSFTNGNSLFFKAKASHSIFFKSNYTNDEIPLTLPPKYQSSTTHKYLVANKYSKISPEILAEVALILTDKDAQLFRSEIFSTIPTFDFTKKDSDEVQKYCSDNPVICDAMDKMKKLYVRDIFKSDYMVAFYEIIGFIPIKFKNYFLITNDLDIDYIKSAFIYMNGFITDNLGVYGILSYILIFLTATFFVFIMIMTFKFRKHSYIKVISPMFCNLIVFGCILNMTKIIEYVPPFSSAKIKFFLIFETIGTNLIYIPMFAVSYRIFRIYKTKTFMSNALNNKRLLISILIAISVSVTYNLIIVLTTRFFYVTVGSVNDARLPIGTYTNATHFNKFYQGYLTIIFISLIFMIIATGSRSKNFGDVCYTFVIFITNISDFIINRLMKYLKEDGYPRYFFYTIIFNCVLHFICVHYLVGSRIQLLLFNPNFKFSSKTKASHRSTLDITQYIALRSKTVSLSFIKKWFKKPSSENNSSISSDSQIASEGSAYRSSIPYTKTGNNDIVIEKLNDA